MEHLYWLVPSLAVAGLLLFFWTVARRADPRHQIKNAQQLFHQERGQLETVFFQAASTSGKPRGLRWKECQWNDFIAWARDKQTKQLLALVGVTISFKAIEGGDMEGVEAVGNLRNASAVFFFHDGRWHTAGRAIFNLNPDEVVVHFKDGYEPITD